MYAYMYVHIRCVQKDMKTEHFSPMPIDLRNCRHFLSLEAEIEDGYTENWVHPARGRITYPTARPHGGDKCGVYLRILCSCGCMLIGARS